jgi:hypothetical protein
LNCIPVFTIPIYWQVNLGSSSGSDGNGTGAGITSFGIRFLANLCSNTFERQSTMPKLSRRGFFKQTSASAVTFGALVAIPGMAIASEAVPEAPAVETSIASFTEPLLAHVSDLASGEISLLVGTREIIFRDPSLVMRLLQAAR